MKRRHFAALAAAASPRPAVLAQDRTTKILVGFPPGGSADVIARLLAEKLRASLEPERDRREQARRRRPAGAGRTQARRAGRPDAGALAQRRAW